MRKCAGSSGGNSLRGVQELDARCLCLEARAIREVAVRLEEPRKEEQAYLYMTDAADYLGMEYQELSDLVQRSESGIPYVAIGIKYIFY